MESGNEMSLERMKRHPHGPQPAAGAASSPSPSTGKVEYTVAEEIANAISHGIGAGLGVAGLAVLVTMAAAKGDVWRVVSFSIYGATLVILYLASTFYHAFQSPRVKRIFRIFDHSAIFLLIAGTYTPFTLVTLRGPWGWTLFGLIWAMAIAGIALKAFFVDRAEKLSVAIYIIMGWLAVIAAKPLIETLAWEGLAWLAAGGLSYTLGVVFYAWKKLPLNHAIWHLFVLGGSVCHFFGIFLYVLP